MTGAASLAFNIIGHDQTKAAFNSAAAGAKKLGAGMKAGIAGAVAAIAGGGLLALGNDMIQIASDVSESTSKVKTLLGDAADSALKFADSSAQAFGMSKNEALAAVGSMSAVQVAMGRSQKESAKLSLEYVKLSADLGSFNNASSAEVQEALTASISGEYEMLKKYGIVVNDTTLATEAQRIGMKKTGATWTSAQKQQLSYNIIMASTKAAQGDFARTSSGLANSTKIVQARFTDLKGALGEKLLPVAVKVMGWLDKGIDLGYRLGAALAPAVAGVQAFTRSLMGNSDANEGMTGGLKRMSTAGIRVALWIRNDFLPAARRIGAFLRDDVVPAIQKTVAWLAASLGPVIGAVANAVRTSILPALGRLVAKFREAWPTISRVIQILGAVVGIILQKVVPVLVRLAGVYLSKVIDVMGTLWSTAWKIIGVVIKVGETVYAAGKRFYEFASSVGGAVSQAYRAVKEWIGKAVDRIKALPGDAVRAVGNLATTLYQKGVDVVAGFINGITDKARELPGLVKDVMVAPVNAILPGFLEIHSPSRLTRRYGRWTVEGFALGIKDRKSKIDDAMTAMTDRIAAAVDKMKALSDRSRGIAAEIGQSFRDFGNLSSLDSGAGFLAGLRDRADKAEAFAGGIADLRRKGLDRRAIEDLTSAGVESGLPAVEQLLNGGDIAGTNGLLARIRRAGLGLGDREALARTGVDPNARPAAVIGGGKQKVVIEFRAADSADEITTALMKALRKKVRSSGGNVQVVLGTR